MRIKSKLHLLAFFMVITIFSTPIFGFAQRNNRRQANRSAANGPLQGRIEAQQDAQADTNQLAWGAGSCVLGTVGACLLGSVGVIGAYAYQPAPPPARFLGKSPQYIESYTKAYKTKVRRLQFRSAAIGCIGGTVINGILWRIYYF